MRTAEHSKGSDYPKNWEKIVAEIRERARNAREHEQCECRGECLRHRGWCEEIHSRVSTAQGVLSWGTSEKRSIVSSLRLPPKKRLARKP